MNKRVKEVIVAIQSERIVYADTNLTNFHRGMEVLEPNFINITTLRKKLKKFNKYYFVNPTGATYMIYRYENSNYVGIK